VARTGRIDAVREQDGALVEKESRRLAGAVRELLTEVPDGGRALAVGHSPLIEAAVFGLTGQVIEPLKECDGVLVEDDGGRVRLAAEYRRGPP
jgi:hypothetical protein